MVHELFKMVNKYMKLGGMDSSRRLFTWASKPLASCLCVRVFWIQFDKAFKGNMRDTM